jgi:hypothetical protein
MYSFRYIIFFPLNEAFRITKVIIRAQSAIIKCIQIHLDYREFSIVSPKFQFVCKIAD